MESTDVELMAGGAGLEGARHGGNGDGAAVAQANGRRPVAHGGGRTKRDGLADFLALFSIGLGTAQVLAPRAMARLVGASGDDDSQRLMRAMGMREIGHGVAILATQPRPTAAVWSRVAGDALDLAMLGALMKPDNDERHRAVTAAGAVLGVTVADYLCAQRLSSLPEGPAQDAAPEPAQGRGQLRHVHAITINRPPDEVYAFWHDFENLPRFMEHLESVQVTGERRSHWKAKAPAGGTVEWDAETTEDQPNELIAWRSLPDADVRNEGRVEFREAPGGRGTELRVEIVYEPPAGKLGATVAKLFREEPGQQVKGDLRRLKQVLEVGEVVLSDASVGKGPHPGQPSEQPPEPAPAR